MNSADLSSALRGAIGATVEVRELSRSLTQVQVPFEFADGDGLVVLLDSSGESLEWTDRGHTLMQLSYELDLDSLEEGARADAMRSILRRFDVEDRDGSLVKATTMRTASEDLYVYCQALIEVADLRTHSRWRVAATFMQDLGELLFANFKDRVHRDWHDERDEAGAYPVDFLVNSLPRPIAIYGVSSNEHANVAALSIRKHHDWGHRFITAAVHADAKHLSSPAGQRLTDTVGKQWTAFSGHADSIVSFIDEEIRLQLDPPKAEQPE